MSKLVLRPKVRRVGIRSAESIRNVIVRLEEAYGKPRRMARFDPMDELISCILSQHASDKSSFPAFTNLRSTFQTWSEVAEADPDLVADAIRNAGLAKQKTKSIQGSLAIIFDRVGDYSLEPLWQMPTLAARDWLMELPGVGPKTASIVLCFSFGRETIPVDTHVFRVATRLGILSATENEKSAHDTLLHLVPADLAFRFHVALIQHGRNVCRAPVPQCKSCSVTDTCAWFKAEFGRRSDAVSPKKNQEK